MPLSKTRLPFPRLISRYNLLNKNGLIFALISPLVYPGEILHRNGIFDSHLQISLITLVVLNSAITENPLSLEIVQEEGTNASEILDLCIKLTPDGIIELFQKLNMDLMCSKKDELKNKAIVGYDSTGFKKISNDFNLFLERGKLTTQLKNKATYSTGTEMVQIEGPTSSVLIAKNPKDIVLNHSASIQIFMPFDEDFTQKKLNHQSKHANKYDPQLFKGDCNYVKHSFKRLLSCTVEIPFLSQITKVLSANRVQNVQPVFEFIKRMIENITLINNLPKLKQNEMLSIM